LSFGLVNLPVGLYPATSDKSIHFNQFETGTSDRIRYKKVNERTGEEVDASKIVKGVDTGGGSYVILSDEELASVQPERSQSIDVTGFVDLAEIDPIFFRSSYFLAPKGDAAKKAYALLRTSMRASNKIAIASLIMRGKEYLVAIRPGDDVLILSTLYFTDEIRQPADELPALPEDTAVSEREVKMAELLIESMSTDWTPDAYHDVYRDKVQELIDEKAAGHTVEVETASVSTPKVVDLMAALEASMDRAKAKQEPATDRATGAAKKTSTPRRATAAKKPAKKVAKAKKAPAKKSPFRKVS
jgi:DNA end-binding protein Ku